MQSTACETTFSVSFCYMSSYQLARESWSGKSSNRRLPAKGRPLYSIISTQVRSKSIILCCVLCRFLAHVLGNRARGVRRHHGNSKKRVMHVTTTPVAPTNNENNQHPRRSAVHRFISPRNKHGCYVLKQPNTSPHQSSSTTAVSHNFPLARSKLLHVAQN